MARTGRSLADYKPKPRDDAYTVLLSISLLAMIAACVLLFFDLKRYPSLKPTGGGAVTAPANVGFTPPDAGGTPAPAPDAGTPAPGAPGTPPPGQ